MKLTTTANTLEHCSNAQYSNCRCRLCCELRVPIGHWWAVWNLAGGGGKLAKRHRSQGKANVEDVEKRTGKGSNKTVDAHGAEENAKDSSCSGHHWWHWVVRLLGSETVQYRVIYIQVRYWVENWNAHLGDRATPGNLVSTIKLKRLTQATLLKDQINGEFHLEHSSC